MVAKPKKERKEKVKVVVARGKRKRSVAIAIVKKGKGTYRINGHGTASIGNEFVKMLVEEPIRLAGEVSNDVDIRVNSHGGGEMGQAQAIRQAVARALISFTGSKELRQRFLELCYSQLDVLHVVR